MLSSPVSAFFSGSETALFSLNKMQLTYLGNSKPKMSRPILRLLNTPNETYTSILLGNTLVNIGAAICAGVMAERLITFSPFLSFLIGAILITSIILIVGEIFPKLLATKPAAHPRQQRATRILARTPWLLSLPRRSAVTTAYRERR